MRHCIETIIADRPLIDKNTNQRRLDRPAAASSGCRYRRVGSCTPLTSAIPQIPCNHCLKPACVSQFCYAVDTVFNFQFSAFRDISSMCTVGKEAKCEPESTPS